MHIWAQNHRYEYIVMVLQYDRDHAQLEII